MVAFVESFQLPTASGASTDVTGAEVGSALGSSDAIDDAEAAGAGVASSLPLSGRVTTTTARRMIPTMIAARTLPEAPCFGADVGADVGAEGFVGALCEATFGVDETSTRAAPRDDDDGTGGMTTEEADVARFFAVDFLTVFFAADFLTADFFTVFFAADFLTADFLTVFFATAFFAVDFLATVFFTALFFTAAFLAAGFFFTATITPCFG